MELEGAAFGDAALGGGGGGEATLGDAAGLGDVTLSEGTRGDDGILEGGGGTNVGVLG